MIEIDASRFKLPPFEHQLDGVKALISNENFALFDEMGAGKTKQVIDAACILYEAKRIDTVVIVCPAQVKPVWLGREFGEVVKHAWVESTVHEFGARSTYPHLSNRTLNWVVASYEYIRQEVRLAELITLLKARRKMLVLDESIFVKNHKAAQAKACFELRQHCDRAVLLNGTPVSNNPLDLYAQFACLDKKILGFKNYFQFRNHHGIMGGYLNKQVIGFVKKEEIDEKVKPFVLRRLKKDCLDLPPKLFTQIGCTLTPNTWKLYCEMRKDMVVWLEDKSSTASHAAVKSLRLAQMTAGFLGGIQVTPEEQIDLFGDVPLIANEIAKEPPLEIGDEKLKAVLDWIEERVTEDPGFRCLFWCRFRAELDRLYNKLQLRYSRFAIHKIQGGQPRKERDAAILEFQEGDPSRPAFLVGQPQAGGFGLTFTTLHTVVYVSNDYNLLTREQSEDRVHRPGQRNVVTYVDVIASGPAGQKTVDHLIVQALRKKEEIAKWTTQQWRKALTED